uniref:WegO-2 putative cnidarian restricted protein n=1 Tax=Clytia hemisphaerica TaxID=252671 RepID=A0A069DNH3_9CNID|eukprot:TCONS_00006705-protein
MESKENTSVNKTSEENNNKQSKPNRPTTLGGIGGGSRSLLTTQSVKIKNSSNQDAAYPGYRRQSLPASSFTKLQVPGQQSFDSCDQDVGSCPGSPSRRTYTPLLTPALSISSLVSSLNGSFENLNLDDEAYFDNDKSPNDPVSMATRKLHFTFEMANREEIVNNRLKYFFNTLDSEEYFENHNGKDIGPLMNMIPQSPMVDGPGIGFSETPTQQQPTQS